MLDDVGQGHWGAQTARSEKRVARAPAADGPALSTLTALADGSKPGGRDRIARSERKTRQNAWLRNSADSTACDAADGATDAAQPPAAANDVVGHTNRDIGNG